MAIISRGLGFVVASYTGTAANLALDLGFIPAHAFGHIGIVTASFKSWQWSNGMSSATGGTALVFGVIATQNGQTAIGLGQGGITTLDGSAGTAIGLTIGTDTTINTAGEPWIVTAFEPM